MNAQEKFELLMQEIGKFFSVEGFRRSGKHFLKLMPDKKLRWNIWPQKSKWNTAEQVEFTFEVYVEWKHRPARSEEWEPKTTWYGAVGNRIGRLMPKNEDTWWQLAEGTSIDFLGDQINGVMSLCVLPFLKQFQTEQEIKNYFRALPIDNYPIALSMLEFDLTEKKPDSVVEESINTARRLGKSSGVYREVIEADIQRIFKVAGAAVR